MNFTVKPNFKEVGKVLGSKIKLFQETLTKLTLDENITDNQLSHIIKDVNGQSIMEESIEIKHNGEKKVGTLTVLNKIGKQSKIIDVGTGAGFPGIPIKIVSHETTVTLLLFIVAPTPATNVLTTWSFLSTTLAWS